MNHKNIKGSHAEDQILALFNGLYILPKIFFMGMTKFRPKNLDHWLFISTSALITLIAVRYLGSEFLPLVILKWPIWERIALVYGALLSGGVFFLGYRHFSKMQFYQRAIMQSGLKNGLGQIPKVLKFDQSSENRIKVVVESFGIGAAAFESKKDSLTAGFRKSIEDISFAQDKGKVIINLIEKDLPRLVSFQDLYKLQKGPYQFIIGQTLKGPKFQSIRNLPHLLISGATGGGKSVFFRSTMLSLLKSSPYIQLYLLDMKRGVEVREFEELPNVHTAKTETEAVKILELLTREMDRRYKILEREGNKSVDPARDNLDIIIVGVDEAASLFGKNANPKAKMYIDELARLARAAGIHLVLATQKPVKDAIDTGTLDNLTGRMTFRMISSAASNVAMGGNLAKKLPPIEGRAMWVNGNEYFEVQAPYIDDKQFNLELNKLNDEFGNEERVNKQKMIAKNFTSNRYERSSRRFENQNPES